MIAHLAPCANTAELPKRASEWSFLDPVHYHEEQSAGLFRKLCHGDGKVIEGVGNGSLSAEALTGRLGLAEAARRLLT
jgi:hypothetical protein